MLRINFKLYCIRCNRDETFKLLISLITQMHSNLISPGCLVIDFDCIYKFFQEILKSVCIILQFMCMPSGSVYRTYSNMLKIKIIILKSHCHRRNYNFKYHCHIIYLFGRGEKHKRNLSQTRNPHFLTYCKWTGLRIHIQSTYPFQGNGPAY